MPAGSSETVCASTCRKHWYLRPSRHMSRKIWAVWSAPEAASCSEAAPTSMPVEHLVGFLEEDLHRREMRLPPSDSRRRTTASRYRMEAISESRADFENSSISAPPSMTVTPQGSCCRTEQAQVFDGQGVIAGAVHAAASRPPPAVPAGAAHPAGRNGWPGPCVRAAWSNSTRSRSTHCAMRDRPAAVHDQRLTLERFKVGELETQALHFGQAAFAPGSLDDLILLGFIAHLLPVD